MASKKKIFIRCGQVKYPPDPTWVDVLLEADLKPEHIPPAIKKIRDILHDTKEAQILISGPVCLGVAIGQAFEHAPVKIEYVQLNQMTKEFEVWVTNTINM